ncbi:hypothetical protein C2845_PM15G22710 [Panicum miliaceum]|uniref:MATH domain-containing protein n=1 Tax=Panicum miliaceum TaxID=4540 RepID=A0A3L6Q7W1_PANMI|nr:hypothetical protein C2845_PM15G22710 [Panicum miliaceum]
MAYSSSCSSSANQTLPYTSSTCSTQSIEATHDFVVTNFSLLDGMGLGKHVSSGTFSVGGTDWSIRLFPDGAETKAHVSVLLSFLRGPCAWYED